MSPKRPKHDAEIYTETEIYGKNDTFGTMRLTAFRLNENKILCGTNGPEGVSLLPRGN